MSVCVYLMFDLLVAQRKNHNGLNERSEANKLNEPNEPNNYTQRGHNGVGCQIITNEYT